MAAPPCVCRIISAGRVAVGPLDEVQEEEEEEERCETRRRRRRRSTM